MLAPRGAQRPLHVRKPHSRSPPGLPFGLQFVSLFVIFRYLFGIVFVRGFLDGFGCDLELIFDRLWIDY